MASYRIEIRRSAAKELEALPLKDRKRIVAKIRRLASEPSPPRCEKLSGHAKYRIRQGDYRVLYAIDDHEALIQIVTIGLDPPGRVFGATLRQVTDAHEQFEGFGETGEFTLAQRVGEEIVFLLRHRHGDVDSPAPVPYASDRAEPMRRALLGESGSLMGLDYRGVRVLAAHEQVAELNLGLVAKIDMAEVRAPFLKAGLLVAGTGAGLIVAGAGLFLLVGESITRRVERSEEHYRSLFENSRDAIALTSREGDFIDVNAAFLDLFGYTREELLNVNAQRLYVNPDDRQRFMQQIEAAGSLRNHEVTLRTKRGAEIECILASTPRRDQEGSIVGYQGIVHDITELKRAEEVLRKSEAKNRALLAAMPDMMFRLSSDGTYLEFLPGSGVDPLLPPEQFIGKRISDVMPANLAEQTMQDVGRVLKTGTPQVHEYELTIDDEVRYYEYRMVPYGKKEVLAVVRDITEHKRAEEEVRKIGSQLQQSVDRMPIAYILWNAAGSIVEWNPAAEKIFGLTRAEAIGRPLLDLVPETDRRAVGEVLRGLLEGRDSSYSARNNNIRKDGKLISCQWFNVPIKNPSGEINLVLSMALDITKRLEAEDELRASRNELIVQSRISHAFLIHRDDDMYQEVLDTVLEALHSKLGFFGYINQEGGLTCPTFTPGVWERCQVADKKIVFPRSAWGGVWGRSLIERRAIYSNDSLHPPEGHLSLTKALAVPIHFGDEVIGQFVVGNKDSDYDEADKMRLEAIASHVAPILHARLAAARHDETRRQAEETLHASRERLRNLAERLHAVREEERTILAREMHDELGQALTGVRMDLQWLMDKLPRNRTALHQRTGVMLSLVDSTINTVREIAWRLRPPILDDLGLTAAIEWYANEVKEHSALELQLDLTKEEPVVDPARAMTVFRIFQEALTNVMRHAEASNVTVTLVVSNGRLVLEVTDDGRGITDRDAAATDALGLIGMRERAGTFGGRVAIERHDEGGTKVKLTLPLTAEDGS